MPIPRDDLMRLLIEIDQQSTELRVLLEGPETKSDFDERSKAIYRFVCAHAARLMVEEKLNVGEKPGQPGLSMILLLCRLSKNWPDG